MTFDARMHRESNSLLGRPAIAKPRTYHVLFMSRYFRPFHIGTGLSKCGDPVVLPSVPHLLATSCPLTVFFAVVSVVVFSFNRMAQRWARPYVAVKHYRVMPFFRDRYAAFRIIVVARVFRVITSIHHTFPKVVDSVRDAAGRADGFTFSAAATLKGVLPAQFPRNCIARVPAITDQFPYHAFPLALISRANGNQFSGSQASNIFGKIVIRHLISSLKRLMKVSEAVGRLRALRPQFMEAL